MLGRGIPKANAATSGVATTRGADAYSYAARRAELQACCASLQAVAWRRRRRRRSITFTGRKEQNARWRRRRLHLEFSKISLFYPRT